MTPENAPLNQLVTSLVPSLSKSFTEQLNVFRVMRHGTHEKQLSNIFAWLLSSEGTHDLGDAFQKIFLARITSTAHFNSPLPTEGYTVSQEVDTSGAEALLDNNSNLAAGIVMGLPRQPITGPPQQGDRLALSIFNALDALR